MYITNDLRTQRPSVPNLDGRLAIFDATCIPVSVSRSKGQRSRSPSPLMLTYIVHHIYRMALPNGNAYILQTWHTDEQRRPASATCAVTSKIKGQGCKVTWSVWAVLAQCCTCVIRGQRGMPCRPNPAATLLVLLLTWFYFDENCD